MINFKIFGVKVEISFLLICFLNLVLFSYGGSVLAWSLFSIMFHEFCHIISLFFFGNRPKKLKFYTSGIVLTSQRELVNFEKIVVLTAGCFGNLLLFLLFYLIEFKFAMVINFCLFIFNLLPHEKFDGGQILEFFLQKIDFNISFKIVKIISNLVSIFLIFLGLIFLFKFKNFTLLFFVIILHFLE